MNTLPIPSTLAPRAATAPAGTAAPESPGDGAGFAAALDLACDPASTAPSCRREVDADASAREPGTIDFGEHGDAADRSDRRDTPELSALLPGWPPAAGPGVAPTTNAATVAVAVGARHDAPDATAPLEALTQRPDAVPSERWERGRGEAAPAPCAAEAIATPMHTPASPRSAVAQAGDASPAPSAAQSETSGGTAAVPNTTSAQTLPLGAAPNVAIFSGSVSAATAHVSLPPFEARLAAAIDSAAFAPALANQVTWLAGEGVQQARIHLNPAEMGPLSVKIVLDGTQARIDFSADLAATRNAIEASLPTLAAALNDQGLTLAGGGVFDGQSRHGTPRERSAPSPHTNPGAAGAPQTLGGPAGTPPLRAARGLVDLVA